MSRNNMFLKQHLDLSVALWEHLRSRMFYEKWKEDYIGQMSLLVDRHILIEAPCHFYWIKLYFTNAKQNFGAKRKQNVRESGGRHGKKSYLNLNKAPKTKFPQIFLQFSWNIKMKITEVQIRCLILLVCQSHLAIIYLCFKKYHMQVLP